MEDDQHRPCDHRGDGDGVASPAALAPLDPPLPALDPAHRRQLATTPGLVGYALDAHPLAKQFWTVSAWTGRPELHQFDRAEPHSVAVKTIRPLMDRSTFVTWTTTASDLPISWDDVRRRIGDAQDARRQHARTHRVSARPA